MKTITNLSKVCAVYKITFFHQLTVSTFCVATANDCYSDRQNALEDVKNGAQGMYVPECTPDNKYQRVQCHKTAGKFSIARFIKDFTYIIDLFTIFPFHLNRQVTAGVLTMRRENPFQALQYRTANRVIAITYRLTF